MKSSYSQKEILLYICLLIGILLADLACKAYIASHLAVGESIEVIKGFFYITYVQNIGAAWGILEGALNIFYVISFVAAIIIIHQLLHVRKEQILTKIGLVMIMAGLIGNLYDRFTLGYVRDFLNFYILGYDYPVFNIADMGIVIGVFCVIADVFLEERRLKESRESYDE
ncbi:MAG: signal peptidase II [bacterium]